MHSRAALARRAGAIYFAFMIVAIIGEFVFPSFTVRGDAAATARNIVERESLYRLHLLVGAVTLGLFIYLVANLYRLFRDVDPGHALVMLLLVAVGVAVAFANLLHKFVPLVLLGGADVLAAFTRPQLDALAHGFMRLHGAASAVATAFWGLWLFPFGMLVIRSGFLPRLLGVLLIVAGVGYLVTSVTSIALPEHRALVARFMMPLYFGELPIIFWLLIRGAKEAAPEATRAG